MLTDGRTDDGRTTDGRMTDAGVTGILIAHLGAFGSGELININNIMKCIHSIMLLYIHWLCKPTNKYKHHYEVYTFHNVILYLLVDFNKHYTS